MISFSQTDKAKNLISNSYKYNKSTFYGAAKYIKNLTLNSKTGELLENLANTP